MNTEQKGRKSSLNKKINKSVHSLNLKNRNKKATIKKNNLNKVKKGKFQNKKMKIKLGNSEDSKNKITKLDEMKTIKKLRV